jgi:hypothetical protein
MKKIIIPCGIFVLICLFFFRPYFFSHKILFPSNLLVSFYTPWNTIKQAGWEQGVPFKGLGYDNLLYFYPAKSILKQAIKEKSLPLWSPYNFSGGPFLGDGQSAIMYPFTWIYALLPLPDAFSIMVILVPFFSLLFTYGLLRHFSLSKVSSIFGAITFAFSGFMSVWMEENPAVSHSAIWLPLFVWVTDILLSTPNGMWFSIFAVLTAIVTASGFLQISIYEIMFIAAFTIFRLFSIEKNKKIIIKKLVIIVSSGLTGLLLVAPYLFTTWEAYQLSPREFSRIPEIRSIFLVQWSHMLSLFNPDWLGNPGSYNYHGAGTYYDKILFIGVIPLVFVLLKLFTKKTSLEKFFFYCAGISMFLGFSSPVTQWLFSQPIPILSSMLPSRIFYIATFALSLTAAFGFEYIFIKENHNDLLKAIKNSAIIYLSALIIIEIFYIAYSTEINLPSYQEGIIAHTIRSFIDNQVRISLELPSILLRNISFSSILTLLTFVLIFFSNKIPKKFSATVVIFLTIISSWYFTNKSLYFGERQFFFPSNSLLTEINARTNLDRIAFFDDQSRIKSALNAPYGLFSPEGLNPVFSYRYGQFIKAAENGGTLETTIPRIQVEFNLNKGYKNERVSNSLKRLSSLLGIKYIIEKKSSETHYISTYPSHKLVWENDFFRLWENPDAFPRAYIAKDAAVISDSQEIIEYLFHSNTDLRNVAVVETPIPLSTKEYSSISELVRIDSYKMNEIHLTVQTPKSGILVLSDTFAPGWKAYVDGIATNVYRTNFIFRGIPITAGSHSIKFIYQPLSFTYGIYAMCIGIIILLLMPLFYKGKKS